jgi:hypothetical protein
MADDPIKPNQSQKEISSMRLNSAVAVCAVAAAACLSAGTLSAQDDGGGNRGRRGAGGGGNFDPAQFQQRMMENIRERLAFTNDTEWAAVEPLVQKVMDARRDLGPAGMGGFGRRGGAPGGGGNDQGGNRRGGFFGQPSPEAEALQRAIDDNAPAGQLKDALTKYRASRKDKEAKLTAAQDNLRKVLTPKQEAQAVLLGLMN